VTVWNYTSNKKPKQGSKKDSEDIALETKAFLVKGGEIEQIPTGVSGEQDSRRPYIFKSKSNR